MGKVVNLACFLAILINMSIFAKTNGSNEYVQHAQELMNIFANKIEKKYGLSCIGTGGGMPYDVETIKLDFVSYNKGSIDVARELVVKLTEELLNEINTNKKVRPFLREHPFEPHHANISVAFWEEGDPSRIDGSVALSFQVKNQVCYFCNEKGKATFTLLLEEPYEEALQIVMGAEKEEMDHHDDSF